MKIAFIAPSFIPSRRANSIQTMKMAQAFTLLGHRVLVIVPGVEPVITWDKDIAPHYGLSEKFELEWVPIKNIFRGYDFALKSIRTAMKWNADLIFTRHPQSAALASKRNIPTIFEAHDLPHGRMGPISFQQFLSGAGCKGIVSISDALLNAINSLYDIDDTPTHTAPDGVDLVRYKDLPTPDEARSLLELEDKFTAGYTGHFYPGRGIEVLLDTAEKLPEVQFLFVGGQPKDIERISETIKSNKLDNVTLTGFIENSVLPKYQAACDVLLMPYQLEVSGSSGGNISKYLSPMKMFEYLAVGRPILSSELPVLKEVLDEGNSILLPPADALKWSSAIEELKVNPELCAKLGKNARNTAQNYSWQSRAENILFELN
jgi:glycosyltransferase involved in cell wall biosynthesis